MFVDAETSGALMGKSIKAAKTLLEEMASNNYHWSSERATPNRAREFIELMLWISLPIG